MKNTMNRISLSLFAVMLSLLVSCGGRSGNEEGQAVENVAEKNELAVPGKPNRIIYLNCRREFNDMNDTHLAAASRIGITPLASRDGIKGASRNLHLIGGALRYNEPFVVDELTHSSPFLVKEAYDLVHTIGRNFQDSLKMKHLPAYSVIVTSVLRTDADVKSLSRHNVNASERSVHCYGTTVDISYRRFAKHDDETPDAREVDLKAVLAEVLRDLRNEGRCYVKYEFRQSCFHITAIK